jgi:hypothetical protein
MTIEILSVIGKIIAFREISAKITENVHGKRTNN